MTPALSYLLGTGVASVVWACLFALLNHYSNRSHAAAIATLEAVIAGHKKTEQLMRDHAVEACIRQFGRGLQMGRIAESRPVHFTSSGN